MERAFKAAVYGLVQGVAFRHHTKLQASELNLTGFVRNLPNGSVEVLAEGEEEALRKLAKWLDQGPPSARVSKVDISWIDPGGNHASFLIAR